MLRHLILLLTLVTPVAALATHGDTPLVIVSCPGGAVAMAKSREQVHCAGALRMPPGRIARVRSLNDRDVARAWERDVVRERRLEEEVAALFARRQALPRAQAPLVTFSELEYAELSRVAAVVDAPAVASIEFARGASASDHLRFAYTPWLGARLREVLEHPGPVLVFQLHRAPNLPSVPTPSFSQAGTSFRPNPNDPQQLGWIAAPNPPSPIAPALGYVVLPKSFDITRPLAIFWGDAVAATQPSRVR